MSDRKQGGEKKGKEDITSLNLNGRLLQNQQTIASSFNNCFLNAAENLIETNHSDKMKLTQNETTLDKVLRNCEQLYPSIKSSGTSSKEIEKLIKLLKTTNAQGYDEISTKILK